MYQTLRGGANAIHLMICAMLGLATTKEERERLAKIIEEVSLSLSEAHEDEQAQKQFDKVVNAYLKILRAGLEPDQASVEEPR